MVIKILNKRWKGNVSFLIFIFLVFFMFILHARTGNAQDTIIEEIQQSIGSHGANWVAGESSLSKLTLEQRLARIVDLKLIDFIPFKKAEISDAKEHTETDLPLKFDWRNYDGQNWVTPVRDQGHCSSCWAHSCIAAIESRVMIKSGNADLSPDYSEQYLISCSFAGTCLTGGRDDYAFEFIRNFGLAEETYFPYQAADTLCIPSNLDFEIGFIKIQDWDYVGGSWDSTDVNKIKTALLEGPLSTWMTIYTDFYYYSEGIYEHVYGQEDGSHTVTIIGWDDTTAPPCWIVKNSWDTDWGEEGYFRVRMGANEANIDLGTSYPQVAQPASAGASKFSVEPSTGFRSITTFMFSTELEAEFILWDFGDGNFGVGQQIHHTYPIGGNFTVKMYSEMDLQDTATIKVIPINWFVNYNKMFSGQEADTIISLLRGYRDEILMADTQGQKLVYQLYENHSTELVRIFLTNPRLAERSASMIKANLLGIKSVLEGGKMRINQIQIARVKDLLDEISVEGSSELKEYIEGVKQVLENGNLTNWGIEVNEYMWEKRKIREGFKNLSLKIPRRRK